jgi:hypothetical protein
VLVHQHLVARLKVRSAEARALIGEALQPVIVFSGVFVSLLLLIAFGLLGFFSNWIVSGRITTHSHSVLIGILFTVYGLAWLVGYALRRAMRQFAAHVLTLALHYYAEATIAGSTSKDVHADSKQEKSC